MTKEHSPFTPGRPVSPADFVGRVNEVDRFIRALRQAGKGRNENIFLTGERGIGKSSLAEFLRTVATERDQFISAHCYLGMARDLNEVCRIIVQELIRENATKDNLDKFREVFGGYVKKMQLGLLGIGIEVDLSSDPNQYADLRLNFLPTMQALLTRVSDRKRGVALILDDINGLCDDPEFAMFLKSVVDGYPSLQSPFPFLLVLVGIEERMSELARSQPSIARIFDVIDLAPLSLEESQKFFTERFESVGVEVEESALSTLTRYSGGLPVLMHEVGDAVFWVDVDDRIERADATAGIISASRNVGRKYLKREVEQAIRSEVYRSILARIGKLPLNEAIRRKELLTDATAAEKRNFDNFIRRMKDLGVLNTHPERDGEYVFANELFRVYFWWQAFSTEQDEK